MYQYGLMGYLLYSLSYNSIPSLLILLLKMFQLWPQEALSAWSQCPLNMIFLDHLLTFWHHKMIQTHLVFSLPAEKHTGSFTGELYLKTKVCVLKILHCYRGVPASSLSQWPKLGNTLRILLHGNRQSVFLFYTHMCISTYMYQESIPVPAQNQGSILDIPLPLFIDFFFHSGKSGSHYLQHVYLFVNASTQLK